MSDDDTPTSEPEAAPDSAEQPVAEGTVATIDEPAAPVEPGHAAEPVERPTFTNRFLLPLLIPIGVAATIIFFVLNISRVFLASDNTLAVIYAAVVTIVILVAGSALAASPRVRSSSLTLMIGGGFLVLLMAGLISIGAASPEGEGGPVQCTPPTSKLTVDAGKNGALEFDPNAPSQKAGCIQISLDILGGAHTLQFDDATAAAAFPQLTATEKSWAGTLAAGQYAFHCTVDGHAQAGMIGTLTVTP